MLMVTTVQDRRIKIQSIEEVHKHAEKIRKWTKINRSSLELLRKRFVHKTTHQVG